MFGRGGPAKAVGASGGAASPPSRLSRFSLLLAANLFVLALLLPNVSFFHDLELKTQDLRLRTRGPRAVHPDVVVIEIDRYTIREGYQNAWPIPRDQYALVIAALDAWGASAIGLDLLIEDADKYDPQHDALLAAVTAQTGNLAHAVYFNLTPHQESARLAGRDEVEPLPDLVRLSRPARGGLRLMQGLDDRIMVLPEILREAGSLGHIALILDADGVTRRAPMLVEHEGREVPALALVMAAHHLGADWREARVRRAPFTGWRDLVLEGERGAARVPVDGSGRTLINFPGQEQAFPNRYSFLAVQQGAGQWIENGAVQPGWPQPEEFAGKVVLVCFTSYVAGTADFGPTPFHPAFPLAYAHASLVSSILLDDHLRAAPRWLEVVGLAVLAVALALVLPALAPGVLALVGLGTLGLLAVASWALLFFGGVQTQAIPPAFLVAMLSVGVLLRGYVVRERERRAVEQELTLAKRIQQDLLPKGPLAVDGVEVAGTNLPCFAVGGDYFDYFVQPDGRICVAIGDVAGKGIPASLLMSNLQATLRSQVSQGARVAEVPEHANALLMESIHGSSKFITFFFAVVDPKTREFRYSNAGHNPPYLIRRDGTLETLETGGLLLGVFPGATYEEGVTRLDPGDAVVLFTDGVTEAEDRGKEQYGEERLIALLQTHRGRSAAHISERICDEVLAFSKGLHQTDDLTVVVVKVPEGSGT